MFLSPKGEKKTSSGSFFSSNIVLCCLRRFFWYTIPFVEYDDLWVCVWSAMESSGLRWHPSSAMPHEYARPEIPWEKDSGPQFPKFNRAEAGCCNLTGFQPIQQTSQTIFWNPLLLQSSKWEAQLSGHALAHSGSIAFQEQHKALTWCQTISKLSWKVFPPQPSQFTGVKHVTHRETGWENNGSKEAGLEYDGFMVCVNFLNLGNLELELLTISHHILGIIIPTD